MDVNTHVRAVWRNRWFVLAGATVLAVLVLLLRLAATPSYTTSAQLYLVPGSDTTDQDITRLTGVYAQLSDNALLLRSTAQSLAPGGPGPAEVRGATTITVVSDGLLEVVASASTAAASARLTDAYASGLSAAVAADQQRSRALLLTPVDTELATVEAQLTASPAADPARPGLLDRRSSLLDSRAATLARSLPRFDVLTLADAVAATSSPQAGRDTLLAFLLGLIVLSELCVVRAVRQGRLDGVGVVGALEELTGLPVLSLARDGGRSDQRAALLALVLVEEQPTAAVLKLLPLDPSPAARGAWQLVADAVDRAGRRPVLLDVDGGAAEGAGPSAAMRLPGSALRPAARAETGGLPGTRQDDVVLAALRSWDVPELLLLAPLHGTTALVVDVRAVRRPVVQEALRVLRLAGSPADLLLLVEGAHGRERLRKEMPEPAVPAPAPLVSSRPVRR